MKKKIPRSNKNEPLKARFFARAKKSRGCWQWAGTTDWKGYGVIEIKKPGAARRHVLRAHRISFEIFNGVIPPGKFICHKCDNPPCVNPKHLFIGDRSDNMQDCFTKGRGRTGILRPRDIRYIRKEYPKKDVTARRLAKKFGVGRKAIYDAAKRKTWRWLP